MTDKKDERRRATYEDVLNAPEHKVAEIIDGVLYLSPRPSPAHAWATGSLFGDLDGPFNKARGGPGGWLILFEPELHLGGDVVVPDLAGWRTSRAPEPFADAFITLAPDWLCETLSPSTARLDRTKKLGVYTREGVPHVWFVHPERQTLEVFSRRAQSLASQATYRADEKVRLEPFETVEIDLSFLWSKRRGT